MMNLSEEERLKMVEAGKRLVQERKNQGNSTPTTPLGGSRLPTTPLPLTPYAPNDRTPEQYQTSPNESNGSAQRDGFLNKRINELTIERTELSAKLWKQEKYSEEVASQNAQLLKRVELLEEMARNSILMQQSFQDVQEKNVELSNTIDAMKKDIHQYVNIIDSHQEEIELYRNKLNEMENLRKSLEVKLSENAEMLENALAEKSYVSDDLNKKIAILQEEVQKATNNEEIFNEKIKDYESRHYSMVEVTSKTEAQLLLLQNETHQKDLIIQSLNTTLTDLIQTMERSEMEKTQLANMLEQSNIQLQGLITQKHQEGSVEVVQLGQRLKEKDDIIAQLSETVERLQLLNDTQKNTYQESIDQLSQKNLKLQNDVERLNAAIIQLTTTSDQIKHQYQSQIQQLHSKIADLESKPPSPPLETTSDSNTPLPSPSPHPMINNVNRGVEIPHSSIDKKELVEVGASPAIPEEFYSELKDYHAKCSNVTWPEDASLEEVQENKIHQLLFEIEIVHRITSRVISFFRSEIKQLHLQIRQLTEDNELLLLACQTGDFQPYLSLQEKRTNELILQLENELAVAQNNDNISNQNNTLADEITTPSSVPDGQSANVTKARQKKGWFSWLRS